MSRKNKRNNKNNLEMENVQSMPTGEDIQNSAKDTMNSVLGTVNENKILIGSIAGAVGAAVFLMATESGKRMRSGIQDTVVDLYGRVSDQLSDGLDRVREMTNDILSSAGTEARQTSSRTRNVA